METHGGFFIRCKNSLLLCNLRSELLSGAFYYIQQGHLQILGYMLDSLILVIFAEYDKHGITNRN